MTEGPSQDQGNQDWSQPADEQPSTTPVIGKKGSLWRERTRPRNFHELTQGRITAAALVLVGISIVGGTLIGVFHPDSLDNFGKAVVEPVIGVLLLIIGYYFGRGSKQ